MNTINLIKELNKCIWFSFALFLLFCCGDLSRRNDPPPPPCQTAATCASLYSYSNPDKCGNNKFSDRMIRIKNNSKDSIVHFVIEYHKEVWDQGWRISSTFINSDQIALRPNDHYDLGCEYDGMYRPGEDNKWIKNVWKLIRPCFASDTLCTVRNNPKSSKFPRINCIYDNCDKDNSYCFSLNSCSLAGGDWFGNELYNLYEKLKSANLGRDAIALKELAPKLFNNCRKDVFNINSRKFEIQGETCNLGIPINKNSIKNIWLRLPPTINGDIRTGCDVELTFETLDTSFHTPMLLYEVINEDGTTEVINELIEEIVLTKNNLYVQGESLMCLSIRYCKGD